MKKINIAVLGPSNIAFRRTVPAIINSDFFNYVGVARASREEWGNEETFVNISECEINKCKEFYDSFGGETFDSFSSVLTDKNIDAVYIPLPPSLHKKWAIKALEFGKHVILEKPFTTNAVDTAEIISLAKKKNLVVHENYAFLYHKQIQALSNILNNRTLGDLRLIRATFSFPYRGEGDFRYHKSMGGGSTIDCGGYPIKLATYFLGSNCRLISSSLYNCRNHDVDVYGCATLEKEDVSAQLSWGMDNSYKCDIEIYGSIGCAKTNRVYSPTSDMETTIIVEINNEKEIITVEPDDQFKNSIDFFARCIYGIDEENYDSIIQQAKLIDSILEGAL